MSGEQMRLPRKTEAYKRNSFLRQVVSYFEITDFFKNQPLSQIIPRLDFLQLVYLFLRWIMFVFSHDVVNISYQKLHRPWNLWWALKNAFVFRQLLLPKKSPYVTLNPHAQGLMETSHPNLNPSLKTTLVKPNMLVGTSYFYCVSVF